MAIITRFGGSGGGTPIVDPYPHVWECTVVQSGTTGVVSGVVTLEAYDILHYTMPLGFSTYDLMIGGVTYHTSFRNEGEMYVQWTGTEFVVVTANAACALPHVWVNPTYTITGSVLEITAGVDDLHTNDVIELTLASGESASVIEYDSNTYTIDKTITYANNVNYVQFNGASFELINYTVIPFDVVSSANYFISPGTNTYTFANMDINKTFIYLAEGFNSYTDVSAFSAVQNGSDIDVTINCTGNFYLYAKEYDNVVSTYRSFSYENTHAIYTLDARYNATQKWIDLTRTFGVSTNNLNLSPNFNDGVVITTISTPSSSSRHYMNSNITFN